MSGSGVADSDWEPWDHHLGADWGFCGLFWRKLAGLSSLIVPSGSALVKVGAPSLSRNAYFHLSRPLPAASLSLHLSRAHCIYKFFSSPLLIPSLFFSSPLTFSLMPLRIITPSSLKLPFSRLPSSTRHRYPFHIGPSKSRWKCLWTINYAA